MRHVDTQFNDIDSLHHHEKSHQYDSAEKHDQRIDKTKQPHYNCHDASDHSDTKVFPLSLQVDMSGRLDTQYAGYQHPHAKHQRDRRVRNQLIAKHQDPQQ